MSDRTAALNQWLDQLGYQNYSLRPASGDASFRTYHRLQLGDQSWIVMDAPPEREPCGRFIAVAQKLRDAKLSAPEVIESDLQQGFLILTDFGSSDYLSVLNPESEALLYEDALTALLQMQIEIDADDLPAYDEALLDQELDLYHHWFLQQLMGVELDDAQQAEWQTLKRSLIDNAMQQPQVFVHRDYHSRNLMKIDYRNPAVLDFQDAVKGPITYDLVSLLRDCYIDWPASRVNQLVQEYYDLLRINELIEVKPETFMRWFNLMGIHRHLKAIGIFSRLKIRDGKKGYLQDIPRTLEYVREASAKESSMAGLYSMIEAFGLSARVKTLETD